MCGRAGGRGRVKNVVVAHIDAFGWRAYIAAELACGVDCE